jgi:adenine phosphoribosyltransferase
LKNIAEIIDKTIRNVPDFPIPGIQFKDITPIFQNPSLCNQITESFAEHVKPLNPDVVVGIESRGFLFGFMLANRLDLPFVLVRKAGKLPANKIKLEYDLEYGTSAIEIHADAIPEGARVIIHDDLLATGGTANACAELIKKVNAQVTAFTFIVELDELFGREKLFDHTEHIFSLKHY